METIQEILANVGRVIIGKNAQLAQRDTPASPLADYYPYLSNKRDNYVQNQE